MASFKEYQMLFQLNASASSGFNATFTAGQNTIRAFQEKINALNKTQSDISSYLKQQSAIEKTRSKVELYATQLANLQHAEASTSKEEAELANAIAAKQKQLDDTTKKLDDQNASLSESGAALRAAGVDTKNLASESERLKVEAQEVTNAQKEEAEAAQEAGKSMKDAMEGAKAALEAAGIVTALKEVYGAFMDCSEAAARYETAMASVKRTVGGTDSFIDAMGESFKSLSTEMPITAEELAEIASTAGQLGISQNNVESFTTVMAKLATTTDLTADNAATMLAQFANITGVTDYERLGSTVAALGDSTATTASKVVDMSQGMAAAASIAGMSSTDILAISAAVGSLGIESAAGSTAMSQLITKLYKATETGDQLEDIASVAGMTAAEFKTAWAVDAVSAMDAFIQGLNDVEQNGRSAVVVLDDLGINNVRQTKAILGLASAEGLLSSTISSANDAWNQNSALTQKAEIMYGTTESKMMMMQNAANNVKIAVGDALNPALGAMYDSVTALLEPIAEWIEANPAIVQGVTAFMGVLGVATTAIVTYTAVTKLASAASAIFSTTATPIIGLVLGIAGSVGLLTAGLSALSVSSKDTSDQFAELDEEFDNLTDQAKHQQQIIDLCEDYETLSQQASNVKKLMSGDIDQTIHFTPEGPTDEEKLSNEDFGISDQTIKYLAEMDGVTYKDVKDKADSLKHQILDVDTKLGEANIKLNESIDHAKDLETQLSSEKSRKKQKELKDELDQVNTSIQSQREEVALLEQQHADLTDEYKIVATAANEVKNQEDALIATREALASQAGIVADISEENADAFDKEASAAKRDREAQLALIRSNMYERLPENVRLYAAAVEEANTASAEYNEISTKQALAVRLQGKSVEEVNAEYMSMLSTLDEMQHSEGWAPSNIDYVNLAREAQDFIDIMAGYDVGDVLQDSIDLADGFVTWADSFGYLSMNEARWIDTLADLNSDVAGTSEEMNKAADVQKGFIDNLVDAVVIAGVEIDEVEKRVEGALADHENAEALVADIMKQVKAGVEAASEAQEDYADSTDKATDAAESQQRSVEAIVDDLKTLQKEYDEAYKAAYSSMDGQFKLFEDAESKLNKSRQKSAGGVNGMTKSLNDQKTYIEEYGQNFKNVSDNLEKAGVSEETANTILNQLSDGSVESAQYLKSLASASDEQLKDLATAYESLKTQKEEYASTVAKIDTDFSDELNKLNKELNETVDQMDMSTEAAENAKTTLDAYVNAADGYVALASAKYGRVGNSAVAALKKSLGVFANLFGLGGYASGTQHAERGMAWVGEDGPELVYFHGGEKVLNAQQSEVVANKSIQDAEPIHAFASESSGNGTKNYEVKVSYHVEANSANAQDIENFLISHEYELSEQIRKTLEEIEEDNQRRALA